MATIIQNKIRKRSHVLRKVKSKTKEILINTLTPNFEYKNAQNLLVRPNTALKI